MVELILLIYCILPLPLIFLPLTLRKLELKHLKLLNSLKRVYLWVWAPTIIVSTVYFIGYFMVMGIHLFTMLAFFLLPLISTVALMASGVLAAYYIITGIIILIYEYRRAVRAIQH